MDATCVPDLPDPSYREVTLENSSQLRSLLNELNRNEKLLLQKVNRRDLKHMRAPVELQVPVEGDLLEHSPFPLCLEGLADVPKTIFVSLRIQAFAAYERERLVHWGPISSGRADQVTPANLYYTNWRSPRRASSINRSWIMRWYFNLHTSMGIAFHQYDMPGHPASYGCIRLLRDDARWIYDWAEEWSLGGAEGRPGRYGTPVIAFGEYDYGADSPWEDLGADSSAARVSYEEATALVRKYLWVLEKRSRVTVAQHSEE